MENVKHKKDMKTKTTKISNQAIEIRNLKHDLKEQKIGMC